MVFYNPAVDLSFTLLLIQDPEDRTYTVTVPLLPGVVSQGATREEAIANGREAIEVHLEGLAADGEPVPVEGARQVLTIPAGRAPSGPGGPRRRVRRSPRVRTTGA